MNRDTEKELRLHSTYLEDAIKEATEAIVKARLLLNEIKEDIREERDRYLIGDIQRINTAFKLIDKAATEGMIAINILMAVATKENEDEHSSTDR